MLGLRDGREELLVVLRAERLEILHVLFDLKRQSAIHVIQDDIQPEFFQRIADIGDVVRGTGGEVFVEIKLTYHKESSRSKREREREKEKERGGEREREGERERGGPVLHENLPAKLFLLSSLLSLQHGDNEGTILDFVLVEGKLRDDRGILIHR